MNIITNKDYILLTKEEQNEYLNRYINHLINDSISKAQSSENYKSPAWPYMQAEFLGSQKVLIKLLKLIKNV